MRRRLPLGIRLYCGIAARVLPLELRDSLGRDINETFADLYREALGAPDSLEPARVLMREIGALFSTAIDDRRRRQRSARLTDLRTLPRTAGSTRPPHRPSPRVTTLIENLLLDLRFGLRSMTRSPVFTLVAALTLALGIGSNAAVFSVVDGVLLADLPYQEPEELALIWTAFGENQPQNWVSGPEFVEMQQFSEAFEALAVAVPTSTSIVGPGGPEQIRGGLVSGDFFPLLGVGAAHGRVLLPEDDVPGGDPRAVLSDSLWRRLGADPGILGTTLDLGGNQATVIGVLPAGFQFLHPEFDPRVDVWLPYATALRMPYEELSRGSHFLRVVGRVRDGVTPAQARADLDRVAARIAEVAPDYYSFDGWGLTLIPMHEDLVEDVEGALSVLLGAVAFVLLIACVNVANLQLARAATRQREIALRTALGVTRGRLLQQLVTEGLMLAALGAALGLGLATVTLRALVALAPAYLPRLDNIAIDGSVLAFTGALGLVTAVSFGVVPWLFALRTSLTDPLKEGGRGAGAAGGGTLRRGLVVVEVALAVVLLVGAGLMLRSFERLLAADPGYRTEDVLTLRVVLPASEYDNDRQLAFWRETLSRIRALGGVAEAGLISELPLSGAYSSGSTAVDSSAAVEPTEHFPYPYIEADRRQISEGYFEAMGIELLAGRTFTGADNRPEGERVAIVDEEFARTFWPDGDPLAHSVIADFAVDEESGEPRVTWARIVGVVRHARHYGVGEPGREQVYFPLEQQPSRSMYVAIRTAGEPEALAATVREQIWAVDPDRPIADLATMATRKEDSLGQPRFNALLLATMALLAVLLAAIGLYGVIAFAVGQRRGEIGVRMALGASATSVRSLVLRQGLLLVAGGLALGIAAAAGLTRLITTLLYAVGPNDPMTYGSVALLLTGVAALACLLPAVRATRVDPVHALRED